MTTYTRDGNVIQVNFQETTIEPHTPVLQVVDTDLLNFLYDEIEAIATNRKGKMAQEIWRVYGAPVKGNRTTVYQYTKKMFAQIQKMGYAEKLAALKRTFAVARIFGLGLFLKDAQGRQVLALNQVTEEMVNRQVEIAWDAAQGIN